MVAAPTAAIPALDPAEVQTRGERIRMVGAYYNERRAGPTHLRYLERREPGWGFWLIKGEEEAQDLELITTITTRHSIRGDGSFDPTHEEYYAQVPAQLLDQVAAIEHSDKGVRVVDGMHEVATRLYKRKT